MYELKTIKVDYKHTNRPLVAKQWLNELKNRKVIACDFEAAVKYTEEDRKVLEHIIDEQATPYLVKKQAEAVLAATPLDHPAHSLPTHLSVAWADNEAYVFVLDKPAMLNVVMQFLVTTDVKQVWHRATYDFMHIYYHTGKMPKDYEDSQIFAKVLLNHVDVHKANTGLKELAGHAYGEWGIASDSFVTENMFDPTMLKYAATDACATYWVYQKLLKATADDMPAVRNTNEDYSPWDQLPMPSPKGAEYPEAYFYHNTAKFLVRDTVRIMSNGLPIDLHKVHELEDTLTTVLQEVHERVAANPIVQRYLAQRTESLIADYRRVTKSKLKSPTDYLVDFSGKNALHRSYYMEIFADRTGIVKPEEKYPTGVSKWPAKLVKKLAKTYKPLIPLAQNEVSPNSPTAKKAVELLAKHKAETYNQKYLDLIDAPPIKPQVFNPASPTQKQEIFAFMGLVSEATSNKTGKDSWNREQIERVNKETEDEDLKDFTTALIDFSFAAIVQNNFIKAFYRYTLDGALHGQYKLLGAKSGRYTSTNPNMLNTPSTGSLFAKPVKQCFVAPEGWIVGAIDYAALEDRVIANLSGDENKLSVFLKGVDGHSLAALYYWPEEASQVIGPFTDHTAAALKFKDMVDQKHPLAVAIRGRGKRISFGLAYGAYPPKVAASAKVSLEEAEGIFDRYHHEMYPGVTDYRENYVLPSAKRDGFVHLGMGFRLYTDAPDKDIRTLNNGTCQFWSILTALTISKLHQLIDAEGLSEDIYITSTIYDSIYFVMRDDPAIVKWLNDTIIPVMEQDFMYNQTLKNSADLEIGPNWALLHTLPHNATIEEIQEVRNQWN